MSQLLTKMLGYKWIIKDQDKHEECGTVGYNAEVIPSAVKVKLLILIQNSVFSCKNWKQSSSLPAVLLQKMLLAMKLDQDQDIYIKNVTAEDDYCVLNSIIKTVCCPKAICLFGNNFIQSSFIPDLAVNKLRNLDLSYKNIPIFVTYSINYILRNPQIKKIVWEDLQKIMKVLNIKY